MTEINAIIIDDEPSSAETLIWDLEGVRFPVNILGVGHGPEEGLELLKKHTPDILFLDIEMPKMNGFDLLRSLDKIDFSVIFTTAYDQYAINAFQINALDYILKPVTHESLENAIQKFVDSKKSEDWSSKISMLEELLQKNQKVFDKIAWPTSEGFEFISSKEIVRCESESNYTHIYLLNGQQLLVSKTLGVVEETIGSNSFLRVHKSHLINLNFIKRFVRADGGYIIMQDESSVPVARRKREDITNIVS